MRTRTAHLSRLAFLLALTVVATMAIRIPAPRTGGYINLGDPIIYITALLFGPTDGLVVGGSGSALADLLGGYAVFAPFTLVIKGVEGLVVGLLTRPGFRGRTGLSCVDLASAMLAICAGGRGHRQFHRRSARAEAWDWRRGDGGPGKRVQVAGGLIVAMPVSLALRRVRRGAE